MRRSRCVVWGGAVQEVGAPKLDWDMDSSASRLNNSQAANAHHRDTEPRTFGRYRVLRRLGDGGMSTVYLGFDPLEKRPVALKVLADHLGEDPVSTSRFRREAELGQALYSPHIVRTFAAERDQ